MSIPITAPTDTSSAEAPVVEESPIHPAWEEAMTVVPESLRGPLIKQIRASEVESQKAIEQARTQSVPKPWVDFSTQAQEAGVDPATLIESYNIRQDLLRDPMDFLNRLQGEVDKAVNAGQITRAEGQKAMAAGAQQVSEEIELKTPEQEQLEALQAQVGQLTQAQQAQYQAAVEQQQAAAANTYYDEFTNTVNATFEAAGYGNAAVETKIAVMRMADSALNGDITDTLTLQKAVEGAFNALIAFRNAQPAQAAPAAQPGQVAPPVGGGNGVAAQAPQKFGDDLAGRKARLEAMIEEGNRQKAAGITL